MQHYTVQDIMALGPCQPTEDRPDAGYPEDKLRRLFGDRQSVTLLDICDDVRVPTEDRQWVLHRLLPESLVHEAVCRYAERALDRERTEGREPDPRSRASIASIAAIAPKRMWLRGEIPSGELEPSRAAADAVSDAARTSRTSRAAASAASWAASRDAARAAVWVAAKAAGEGANWDDAWDDAWAAEGQWQLATLRAMIEEMEG